MENPIVNHVFLLQKFPGKGGWTYVEIYQVKPDKSTPFGWVKVKGSIDDFHFSNYRLQPMGNGKLFLPVKAEIRKKIGKREGDTVRVVLYRDDSPQEIPEELTLCLRYSPDAHSRFLALTEGRQKGYIDWIYSAKTEETKANRIASMIQELETEILQKKK